ncbi:MAG: TatD family hydrolase [Firmicutes bacterium]|nr:TatD family hydrolase [Bacillota bacterium]
MSKVLLADSHVHLLDARLLECIDETVRGFDAEGIAFVVEAGTCFIDSKRALQLAAKYDNVYCTIGVHPHEARDYETRVTGYGLSTMEDDIEMGFEEWARHIAGHKKIVAVGECGLDYHYDHSPRDVQRDVFARQIRLAHELKLPLVVHSREAFDDTFNILLENKSLLQNGVLFHCFGYGALEAEKLTAEFDAYFAFGGALTFGKKTQCLVDALKIVPHDRILLETDCPYLSPVPCRGQINQPRNVRLVAQHVAKLLDKTELEIAVLTLSNTKRFFHII